MALALGLALYWASALARRTSAVSLPTLPKLNVSSVPMFVLVMTTGMVKLTRELIVPPVAPALSDETQRRGRTWWSVCVHVALTDGDRWRGHTAWHVGRRRRRGGAGTLRGRAGYADGQCWRVVLAACRLLVLVRLRLQILPHNSS